MSFEPRPSTAPTFPWGGLRLAGRGAGGTVYEGRRGAERAAIKVARPDVADSEAWLAREAELAAKTMRRWGPTFLDAGAVPEGVLPEGSGRVFVATTWSEGEALDQVLRTPLAHDERRMLAAIVAHGVARGLEELHGVLVRHGDVKPANILVAASPDGDRLAPPSGDRARDRRATLVDLDLAADVDEPAAGGTARYAAPELRAGLAATPPADLFALGIVLAEILALDPEGIVDRRPAEDDTIVGWIAALLAPAPGARPSAAWLATRAARHLGLALDREEEIAARRARVRRAYVSTWRASNPASSVAVTTASAGTSTVVAGWQAEARAVSVRLASLHGTTGGADPDASRHAPARPVAPSSAVARDHTGGALALARWLVMLVGAPAAAWSIPPVDEETLAARLLALCERAPPEAWTHAEVFALAAGDGESARGVALVADATLEGRVALARLLAGPSPSAALLDAAEAEAASGHLPAALVLDLARALTRRGDVGRAYAVLESRASAPAQGGPIAQDLALVRADVARRRGDAKACERLARPLAASPDPVSASGAKALLARLAWEAGDLVAAERLVADASGAAAAELRGLVAYSRGELAEGIAALEAALLAPADELARARLEGTRGMLEHARGASAASQAAFARAVELSTAAGAVVEEATYLTGLAAAAVDVGAIAPALAAATRAALIWERAMRPGMAARAHLSRASAFALVGASHEALLAAHETMTAAIASNDPRARAFAGWVIASCVDARDGALVSAGEARREARAADAILRTANGTSPDDLLRSAARLLIHAEAIDANGAAVDVAAFDAASARATATARWEWWGARAATAGRAAGQAIVGALVELLELPAPVGARGEALAAGARLAREIGDGDAARRLEAQRRVLADALRAEVPASYRADLAEVAWMQSVAPGDSASPLGSAQVEQLESIVRALSSRDRLKPLLDQVLDTMILWTGVERGLLLLRAPDGRLVTRVARNLARRDLSKVQLELSMGLAQRALATRQAVLATDAFAQVGDLHASVHALGLRSVLAVPLVARGDALGVVYLDDRVRRGAFGPSELSWVRLVASQAALAIADARDQALLRRAVRHAERARIRLEGELGHREAELVAIRAELASSGTRFPYDDIVGRSDPMRAMLKLVDRVTASDVPVLFVGESGTGKELVARAIHVNGARSSRPFVSENCASVPETLLESTLFGHVRGAFTGASSTRPGLFDVADGGTLFLDEIGEMPLTMQSKLLRVLQNGEVRAVGSERAHTVDVRIVGATHRDLEAMVAAGTFREDLFYRLNVVTIRVPPLRERAGDIPILVQRLVAKHAGGAPIKVTRAAMDRLAAYPWPGNVRQLENEVRRALVLVDGRIDVSDLSDEVARGGPSAARDAGLGLKARVDALETQLVREALDKTKGNQTRAAEILGVSRFGLQKMMRRLNVRTKD